MRTGAWIFALCLWSSAVATAAAQPLTHRSPNIEGTWVTSPWNLHFQFNHRFRVFGDDDVTDLLDEGTLDNSPTFTLSLGLWSPLMAGVKYATAPAISNGRRTNEWFPYLKAAPLRATDWSVSVLGGYNTQAESFDGEVSGQASVGPLELLGAVRGFSHALHTDEEGLALAGGVGLRVTDYIVLAGDVGGLVAGPDTGVAWSAGVQLGIPFTPHTFSLQVSNSVATTLQEASFDGVKLGGGDLTWGFEFTVPFSGFARWGRIFDRTGDQPGGRAGVAAKPRRVVEVDIRELRFEADTVRVGRGAAVRWINRDHVVHSVVASGGALQSPLVGPGETYTARFEKGGVHRYRCSRHPYMRGVIIVEESTGRASGG